LIATSPAQLLLSPVYPIVSDFEESAIRSMSDSFIFCLRLEVKIGCFSRGPMKRGHTLCARQTGSGQEVCPLRNQEPRKSSFETSSRLDSPDSVSFHGCEMKRSSLDAEGKSGAGSERNSQTDHPHVGVAEMINTA
jgi:hypothetical protein